MSSFGAAIDQMTRELLAKNGIDPQRDVVLRAIEPTPADRRLMSGAVDAAVLNQLDSLIAKKNGYNELLFYGDHLEFVTAGVAVARKDPGAATGPRTAISAGNAKGFLLAEER